MQERKNGRHRFLLAACGAAVFGAAMAIAGWRWLGPDEDGRSPLIVVFVGALICVAAIAAVVIEVRARRLRTRLRTHGHDIWVPIARTDVKATVDSDTGRPDYFVVQANWNHPRTGAVHRALSERLRFDPSEELRTRSAVRVLFDPERPKRCFIDLDDLLGPP